MGAAACIGIATAAVMTLAALCGWLVRSLALVPLHAEYMTLTALALLCVALAYLAAAVVRGVKPALAEKLGEGLPMIAANCAVLGVALIDLEKGASLLDVTLGGLFGGLGFLLAIVLMAGVKERIAYSKVPAPLKGLPISLISAGLVALAFMGFMGLA